ncbi:hypothetical protein ['Paenibacillus yunnanensis' Narsing Rao et al. 2020]|uniref:hypothetical protein n=1 Tax=Paenibacillus tengchongensis TaxID=2608684 RepID=UPI001652AAD4|nr:hypothetical protein [Paenibacillus tengchongensis]
MSPAGYIGQYLSKGWQKLVEPASIALATAMAMGLVELAMELGFKGLGKGLKKAGAAVKKGATVAAKGAKNAASAGVRSVKSLLKSGATLASKSGSMIIRNGKVVIKNLQKGFTKGVTKLKGLLDKILNRFKFKRFELERKGRYFWLYGIVNPKIEIMHGKLPDQDPEDLAKRGKKSPGSTGSEIAESIQDSKITGDPAHHGTTKRNTEIEAKSEPVSTKETGNGSEGPKKTRWQYITEWHDKRVSELFGNLDGRRFNDVGRNYDARYKGKDIEYKSDNFNNGPRTQSELTRMERQIEKDIKLLNSEEAKPHWHFEHNPTTAPEMKPLLDKLTGAGIPWTYGPDKPF